MYLVDSSDKSRFEESLAVLGEYVMLFKNTVVHWKDGLLFGRADSILHKELYPQPFLLCTVVLLHCGGT